MLLRLVLLASPVALVLLGLGGCSTAATNAGDGKTVADSLRSEWAMKEYQFVTLTRNPDRPELDPEQVQDIMSGHLAHLDSLYAAGIIRLVGPFGDDRNTRGLALLDVPDSATAMAHMSVDPSVKAGIFTLDSRPWWGPASIDLSGAAPNSPAP